MASTHYCPTDRVHFTWDTGNEPLLTVADGDTVVFETRDVSDNQIGPGSDASVIADLDWSRVYPLAGPVYVEGAEPGDTLAVEILDLHTKGWGWTAILPGFGLLERGLHRALPARLRPHRGDVTPFREDIIIPLTPFMGTMGVCPAGASAQPVMPPGTFGGNLDTRQLVAGHDALPPGPGRGRAVLDRRRPRLPGRRRDLRHRPRVADVRRHQDLEMSVDAERVRGLRRPGRRPRLHMQLHAPERNRTLPAPQS